MCIREGRGIVAEACVCVSGKDYVSGINKWIHDNLQGMTMIMMMMTVVTWRTKNNMVELILYDTYLWLFILESGTLRTIELLYHSMKPTCVLVQTGNIVEDDESLNRKKKQVWRRRWRQRRWWWRWSQFVLVAACGDRRQRGWTHNNITHDDDEHGRMFMRDACGSARGGGGGD